MYLFSVIGYGYKSSLVNIYGSDKNRVFKKTDYLVQVLKPSIQSFLEAFLAVCAIILFIKDSNSVYSY